MNRCLNKKEKITENKKKIYLKKMPHLLRELNNDDIIMSLNLYLSL